MSENEERPKEFGEQIAGENKAESNEAGELDIENEISEELSELEANANALSKEAEGVKEEDFKWLTDSERKGLEDIKDMWKGLAALGLVLPALPTITLAGNSVPGYGTNLEIEAAVVGFVAALKGAQVLYRGIKAKLKKE